MSVPIKELQNLASKIPPGERQGVKRFLEFVISGSAAEAPSPAEISMMNKSEEEIARGECVEWKPGMFLKSKSPKPAASKSTAHRSASGNPSRKPLKK